MNLYSIAIQKINLHPTWINTVKQLLEYAKEKMKIYPRRLGEIAGMQNKHFQKTLDKMSIIVDACVLWQLMGNQSVT